MILWGSFCDTFRDTNPVRKQYCGSLTEVCWIKVSEEKKRAEEGRNILNKIIEQVYSIKYIGIFFFIIKWLLETMWTTLKKMHKVNIYTFKIGKIYMGAEARGFENNIFRRNFTTNFIWSPSVEKGNGQQMLLSRVN